jgi:L,D-transpeptidase catalytic domain
MNLKSLFSLSLKGVTMVCIGLALPALFSSAAITQKKILNTTFFNFVFPPAVFDLYTLLSLDSLGLSKEAFREAVTGYQNLQQKGFIQNRGILSIVDYSLPSFKKRLFVLDLENGRLLFNTLVAHGRNSGEVLATRFSNRFRSFKSSLGFYLTGETYVGQNGYSLRLLGIEQGINDHAYSRGIVVHGADYVNDEVFKNYGRLGRSEGCPAIPTDIHQSVIEMIKNGTCFFIYGKDKRYSNQSRLLSRSRNS